MQPILKEISVLAIKILHILKHAKDYLQRYLELENLLNIETRFENPLQDMHPISNLELDIPINFQTEFDSRKQIFFKTYTTNGPLNCFLRRKPNTSNQ